MEDMSKFTVRDHELARAHVCHTHAHTARVHTARARPSLHAAHARAHFDRPSGGGALSADRGERAQALDGAQGDPPSQGVGLP
eukprot:6191490-Pleurochrysis_carterae.AAC.1